MDKLIITILSIAIGAATLYASADYLSGFYRSAQARSKAQIWVAEATQIAVAAKQAGYLSSGADNWAAGTAIYLVTGYMASLPRHDGSYVFSPCYVSGLDVLSCPRNNTDATIISAAVENAQVCEEIQKMANRGTSTLTKYTTAFPAGFYIPKNSQQRFACAWFDLNGNNQYDASGTDAYYFLYRVFLERGSN